MRYAGITVKNKCERGCVCVFEAKNNFLPKQALDDADVELMRDAVAVGSEVR